MVSVRRGVFSGALSLLDGRGGRPRDRDLLEQTTRVRRVHPGNIPATDFISDLLAFPSMSTVSTFTFTYNIVFVS